MFKLLFWIFGYVEKTAWLDENDFKIYDVTASLTNNDNTHIAQYLTK